MAILYSDEILKTLCDELSSATKSVQVITAYCKLPMLIKLLSCVPKSVQCKKLLIRFRLDDIVKGSTDFSVLKSAKDAGFDIYLQFNLHAKTYVVDDIRGIVGSANVTESGLSEHGGNLEIASLEKLELADVQKINMLYFGAIFVTDELIEEMKSQIPLKTEKGQHYIWNKKILSKYKESIKTLFEYELPDKQEYDLGDYIAFIDIIYDGNKELIKEELFLSNVYHWLIQILKNKEKKEIYFGELSSTLHDSLIANPKPYRKDVKVLLSNLLGMIEWLEIDEIIIDKPNYSQRISLK